MRSAASAAPVVAARRARGHRAARARDRRDDPTRARLDDDDLVFHHNELMAAEPRIDRDHVRRHRIQAAPSSEWLAPTDTETLDREHRPHVHAVDARRKPRAHPLALLARQRHFARALRPVLAERSLRSPAARSRSARPVSLERAALRGVPVAGVPIAPRRPIAGAVPLRFACAAVAISVARPRRFRDRSRSVRPCRVANVARDPRGRSLCRSSAYRLRSARLRRPLRGVSLRTPRSRPSCDHRHGNFSLLCARCGARCVSPGCAAGRESSERGCALVPPRS